MRIVEEQIFAYSELSDLAKQRVREDLANDSFFGDWILQDFIISLKELAKKTRGKIDYSISLVADRGEYITLKDFDCEILNSLIAEKDKCPLTGFCYDIAILESIDQETGDISSALRVLHDEYESIFEDEYLTDYFEGNQVEFYENGREY